MKFTVENINNYIIDTGDYDPNIVRNALFNLSWLIGLKLDREQLKYYEQVKFYAEYNDDCYIIPMVNHDTLTFTLWNKENEFTTKLQEKDIIEIVVEDNIINWQLVDSSNDIENHDLDTNTSMLSLGEMVTYCEEMDLDLTVTSTGINVFDGKTERQAFLTFKEFQTYIDSRKGEMNKIMLKFL